MEGVSTLMPTLLKIGVEKADAQDKVRQLEARAQGVEAQTLRQAEAAARQTREDVHEARGEARRKAASARAAAGDSGLEFSGSSLLSMQGLEREGERGVGELAHESALRVRGIVDSGAEQVRSIRLAGRNILRAQERQSLLQLYPAISSVASSMASGRKS